MAALRSSTRRGAKRVATRLGVDGIAAAALDAARPQRRHQRMIGERNEEDNATLARLLAFTLRPADDCIDIGANRGAVLTDIVRLAPEGRHLAFEPLPELADELRRRFPDVDVRQAAVSDTAGTSTFTRVVDSDELSGLRDRGLGDAHELQRFEVEVVRLDDVLPDGCRPRFIKIDVEGAELGVLRGAAETLREHRPTIWFEHGREGAPFYDTSPGTLWDLLCGDLGYRIFDSLGRGPYDRDGLASPPAPPVWNYVAR